MMVGKSAKSNQSETNLHEGEASTPAKVYQAES